MKKQNMQKTKAMIKSQAGYIQLYMLMLLNIIFFLSDK